ncbi:MAG: helix-turn-helix domain-containing protein [Janthinobacterium lividum]
MEKQLLTARDVAPLLGVGVSRVHQMLRAGELPSVRWGPKEHGIRIPRQAFEEWMEALRQIANASVKDQNLETSEE